MIGTGPPPMRALPCDEANRLRRPLQTLVDVLGLELPEGVSIMAVPTVRPVVDVLGISDGGACGDVTTVAPVVLPDVRGAGVLVQADPSNTDDVLLGIFGFAAPFTLQPGQTFSGPLARLSALTVASAGAAAVRVVWAVRFAT